MTPEKLASLLTTKSLTFNDCKVHLNEESKLCQSGVGSIYFSTKAECKPSSTFIQYTYIVVSAAKALKGLSLDEGKKVDIKTPNNGDYNSQTSIFINNLNESVNESLLIEEFS